jgi:hypothetical protein
MAYAVLHLAAWLLTAYPYRLVVTSDCIVGVTATYLGQERKYQQNDRCIPKSVSIVLRVGKF